MIESNYGPPESVRFRVNLLPFYIIFAFFTEVEVLWMANVSVEVKVKNRHQGRLCGLCGNFNHDPDDEFQLKNSRQITSLERFVKSFEVSLSMLSYSLVDLKRSLRLARTFSVPNSDVCTRRVCIKRRLSKRQAQ